MFAIIGNIAQFIGITIRQIVLPLLPVALYGMIVVLIITFCFIIASVGGSFLFYFILAFYVKALFSYNPDEIAKQEAMAAQMAQQAGNNNNMGNNMEG